MNAVGFLNNFKLAHKALNSLNTNAENRFKMALELSLKMEEIELQNKDFKLKEEQVKQELELKALESRNKYENASVELIKNMVQAKSMVKSVWDNANINKCNALVGLFNVAMNAQNTTLLTNWKQYFDEIKNSIFAIGQDTDIKGNKNDLVTDYNPLLKKAMEALNNLFNANNALKQVGIFCPKYEILVNENLDIRGYSLFAKDNGFIVDNITYKNTDSFSFKKDKAGEYEVTYFSKNEKNETLQDSVTIKVVEFESLKDNRK